MPTPPELRVATFNLRHGRVGAHWPCLPWRLRAGARLLQADIAAFQEVDRRVVRSWFLDQAALCAKAVGATDHAFAFARPFGPGGQYGNALAVRGTIDEHTVVELPRGVKPERRVCLLATVTVRGVRLRVAATHLQNHDPDALAQLGHLCDLLADEALPTLLLGDLNLGTDEVGPRVAAAGLALAGGADSSPVDEPWHRIDHVAARGLTIGEVEVPRPPVSDHRPVIAGVTVP